MMNYQRFKKVIFSSPRKQFNLILWALSYFLKLKKPLNRPFYLMIEPSSICNLRCATCPVGTPEIKKKPGVMDFELFKKIIDENYKTLYMINLWNWGEPFVNKDLARMAEYARKKNIFVKTSTNGHFLNDQETIKNILNSGINEIIVALDGLSQETLEKYRKNSNFDVVYKGLRMLTEEKRKKGLKLPVIQLQFIAMKHNEHEIGKLKDFANKTGVDKVVLKTFGSHLDIGRLKEFEPKDKSLSRYSKKIKRKACTKLWHSLNINYDGNVVACCYDPKEKYVFGNVKNESVKNIWVSGKYKKFREYSMKGLIDICRDCDFNNNISNEININKK